MDNTFNSVLKPSDLTITPLPLALRKTFNELTRFYF
jgi:hypothetical protein